MLFRNVPVANLEWEDEKSRSYRLQSLRIFGALDSILILDYPQRLAEDGDGLYLVPDIRKIIVRTNRYRAERFLNALEKWGEAKKITDMASQIMFCALIAKAIFTGSIKPLS